jgi:hypothetical protein
VTNDRSLRRGCGYWVTQDGHDALMSAEACHCILSVQGGLFVCRECGTVWSKAGFTSGGRPEISVPRWSR